MNDDDDETLVARVLERRDERAFRELYRRHTPVLYLLALRLLGPYAACAEDVVQETWVRAITNLTTFAWTSALRTWLCGIVVNRCREIARSRVREERALAEWTGRPAVAQGWTTETLALERAIAALPDASREVLVLHDVYGFTHKELAALLGIAVGTSKSQLHDARRALRSALRDTIDGGVTVDERR